MDEETIYTHTHINTKTCSDRLYGSTGCFVSLLPCNVADLSAGLCLSPFVKSCGCWLHSTGKVQMVSDVCCSPKWSNDLMTGKEGGGGSRRDPAERM